MSRLYASDLSLSISMMISFSSRPRASTFAIPSMRKRGVMIFLFTKSYKSTSGETSYAMPIMHTGMPDVSIL